MHKLGWLVLVLLLALPLPSAVAQGWRKDSSDLRVLNNVFLHGKVADYTANHGCDNRLWSRSLYQRRDVYVYLPPGFDPNQRYPLMIWLHGFGQDEKSFLADVVPCLDKAIVDKCLPPMIVAAPDGSVKGEQCHCTAGTFFLNSRLGAFEDFVLEDVWDFVCSHYPINSDRNAHVVAGLSMGGFAAYNYAIRHREAFGVVMGICPPLNLRWMDAQGNYAANFDPRCWGWRTEVGHGQEVVARFCGSCVAIRLRHLLEPVFGLGPEALVEISKENPIEMLERCQVREGELAMYIAYVGLDEFNIDAQVESFLYLAAWRHLSVAVDYDPYGRHHLSHMLKALPGALTWLGHRLAPYAPCGPCGPGGCCAGGFCPAPPPKLPEPTPPRW